MFKIQMLARAISRVRHREFSKSKKLAPAAIRVSRRTLNIPKLAPAMIRVSHHDFV